MKKSSHKTSGLARIFGFILVFVFVVSCAPRMENEISVTFTPVIIDGVKVYGINEKISTHRDIVVLYDQIDNEFESESGIKITDKYNQRIELLDPNERYLEVPVWQSAYDSFESRKRETGVNFVEWINMHVDAMNMVFENAKPSSNMRAVLRRIIVIQDTATDKIWSVNAFNNGAYDLNVNYRGYFKDEQDILPLDTDTTWAIAFDYRVDTKSNVGQGNFWSSSDIGGEIEFSDPPGSDEKIRVYRYPDQNNSLSHKNNVWLDFGLTHEWLHYLFNLPDEYAFDVHMDGEPKMIFITGSFHEPWLSPYLSMLSQNQIDKKIRDSAIDGYGNGYNFQEVTNEINLFSSQDISGLGVKIVRFGVDNSVYFPRRMDFSTDGTMLTVEKNILQKDRAHVLMFNFEYQGAATALYLPYAAFDMSKLAGEQTPLYRVEIVSEIDNQKTQSVALVDASDIDAEILDNKTRMNWDLVAKMYVAGTNSWYLWFQ